MDYLDALDERVRYSRVWQGFFEGYDVLLTPMMQMTALPLGLLAPTHIAAVEVDPFFDDWCEFCFPANLTGMPATTLPCGEDEQGLPVGLQVMAPRGHDLTVLAVAAALETAFGELTGLVRESPARAGSLRSSSGGRSSRLSCSSDSSPKSPPVAPAA